MVTKHRFVPTGHLFLFSSLLNFFSSPQLPSLKKYYKGSNKLHWANILSFFFFFLIMAKQKLAEKTEDLIRMRKVSHFSLSQNCIIVTHADFYSALKRQWSILFIDFSSSEIVFKSQIYICTHIYLHTLTYMCIAKKL